MLGEQPIVMYTEFGALDYGALARPTQHSEETRA
jgi:hypothetical protein